MNRTTVMGNFLSHRQPILPRSWTTNWLASTSGLIDHHPFRLYWRLLLVIVTEWYP
jgi:hypothetical protein